jgi:hypothetical protein
LAKTWDLAGSVSAAPGKARISPAEREAEYLRGIRDGMAAARTKEKDAGVKALTVRAGWAHGHTTEVFAYLRSIGFKPRGARLRIVHTESFEVLILIPSSQFLSKKMSEVYSHLFELRTQWSKPKYKVNFRFASANTKAAVFHMECDGYELTYIEKYASKGAVK